MPKSEKQKAKILLIARYLWEQTDENHGVSSADIRDYLEDNGIETEEHSIYRDIAALRDEFVFSFGAIKNIFDSQTVYYCVQ